MSNPPIDVAELIKLICKIFWSSIYVRLSGKILGDSFEIHILCYFLYSEIEQDNGLSYGFNTIFSMGFFILCPPC